MNLCAAGASMTSSLRSRSARNRSPARCARVDGCAEIVAPARLEARDREAQAARRRSSPSSSSRQVRRYRHARGCARRARRSSRQARPPCAARAPRRARQSRRGRHRGHRCLPGPPAPASRARRNDRHVVFVAAGREPKRLPTVLERVALQQEALGALAQHLLFVGQVEVHAAPRQKPKASLAMMFFCTSRAPP